MSPPSLRKPFDQHARIAPSVPHRLQIGIELIDQRRDRQHRAVGARFLEREAQVLAHPVDREAEVELDLRHRAPARSVAHTYELQSLMRNSYDVFCLKKKYNPKNHHIHQKHKAKHKYKIID